MYELLHSIVRCLNRRDQPHQVRAKGEVLFGEPDPVLAQFVARNNVSCEFRLELTMLFQRSIENVVSDVECQRHVRVVVEGEISLQRSATNTAL